MYETISHSLLNILCIHEQIYLSFYTECFWLLSWSHLYRKSWMSLEKQCGTHTHTHTEYEHRKIQYFRTEYQTTSITFQSNMTLKTVVSVIPLVYVKKKKRKKKKKSVWVALKRKWRGNGQKKRGM